MCVFKVYSSRRALDGTVEAPGLLPEDLVIVLSTLFFVRLVDRCFEWRDQIDRDSSLLESSARIMPVSRLEKKGLRYGTHAVMMPSA